MSKWVADPDAAVAGLRSGQTIALGGFLSARNPMALARALARRGLKDLTLVAAGGGLAVDLLVGSGAVRQLVIGLCSLDLVGPAPHFRAWCESGRLEVVDYGGGALAHALEATARGLAAQPARVFAGSGLRSRHPGRPDPVDPGVLWLPAMQLDAVLLHVERSDADGNLRFLAPSLDLQLAWAADQVIATVEQVLPRADLGRWGNAGFPRGESALLVEQPLGAHPTSCHPDHAADYEALLRYAEAGARSPEELAPWIGASEAEYRGGLSIAGLVELRSLAARGGFLACASR